MWSSCNRSRVFEEHRRPLLRHSVVCNVGTHCRTHSPGDTSSLKADAHATLQNTSSPRNRGWPESLQSRWLCWCSTFPILLTWVEFLSNFNYTLKLSARQQSPQQLTAAQVSSASSESKSTSGRTAFILLLCYSLLAEINQAVCLRQATVFTLNDASNESHVRKSSQPQHAARRQKSENKNQVYWKLILVTLQIHYSHFNDPSPPFSKKGWCICHGQIHSIRYLHMLHWSLIICWLAQFPDTPPTWVTTRTGKRGCTLFLCHLTHNQCWRHVHYACIFLVSLDRRFLKLELNKPKGWHDYLHHIH